jgi:hypothetical protein
MRKTPAQLDQLMMLVLLEAERCNDSDTRELWYRVFAELMMNPRVH